MSYPFVSDRPSHIQDLHWHEWRSSCVLPEIISLNVCSLNGEQTYEHLLYSEKLKRINSGRLSDSVLRKYQHLEQGGWWVSGLDPLNDWGPMEWGRFKPDHPRHGWDKERQCPTKKLVKYESPPLVPNRVTYFRVPQSVWELVAAHHGIAMPDILISPDGEALGFWAWVAAHPEISVTLTEGEKKAAALLSLGFPAIALPGIWNGRISIGSLERLHPDLIPMATGGRKFQILFDYETKLKTRRAVFSAILRTGAAIDAQKCVCQVIALPGPEKGIDDWIAANSSTASQLVSSLMTDYFSLRDYRRLFNPLTVRGLSKYQPNLEIDIDFLSKLVQLPASGLVVLHSDMGTGKTELLVQWRKANPKLKFLNNGHRVNLLKNLASRLETEFYSALGVGDLARANALSITVDSLYKLQTEALNYGCIFIDEAVQYLAHLLHSQTCKEHRGTILEVLEYLISNAPLVVIADAHMDDITVDFFRAMRPQNEEPFVIKNHRKSGGRKVFWHMGDDSSSLVAKIHEVLMAGKKPIVLSDSKRFIKKIERMLTQSGNEDSKNLRVWAVHSENSGSDENANFIKEINKSVKTVDALLASPSLGTGVDIKDYHFDVIFGVFHSTSQTATECAQMLWRYRPNVSMHIWVAPRPPFGYRECNAERIKERLLQSNEMTAFLIKIERETGRRGAEKDWALDAYCNIEAKRNSSINNLRDDLRSLLEEMGNFIEVVDDPINKVYQDKMKTASDNLKNEYRAGVANSGDISKEEYRSRQSKDYQKPEEYLECEKFRIWDSYGKEVTPELVEQDDGGKMIRRLVALEAVLSPSTDILLDEQSGKEYPAPPALVAERDLSEREHLPICTDWHNYSSGWLARHVLGLHEILQNLIAGKEFTGQEEALLRMKAIAVQCAAHIKAVLGITIPADSSPIWILALLIEQLGLKLKSRKVGPRGGQVLYYSLAEEELHFAQSVLAHREQKRQEREKLRQEAQQKTERYVSSLQNQYEDSASSVSSPPHNNKTSFYGTGVDTETILADCHDFLLQLEGGGRYRFVSAEAVIERFEEIEKAAHQHGVIERLAENFWDRVAIAVSRTCATLEAA